MWSKFQRKLYDVLDPNINLQVHMAEYPPSGKTAVSLSIPRFWITLDKEIIFDCPHDFMKPIWTVDLGSEVPFTDEAMYVYRTAIRYMQTPVDSLLTIRDCYGLFDILVAADRRIGKRRWPQVYAQRSPAAPKVLIARGFVPPIEHPKSCPEAINEVLSALDASNTALKNL